MSTAVVCVLHKYTNNSVNVPGTYYLQSMHDITRRETYLRVVKRITLSGVIRYPCSLKVDSSIYKYILYE